MAVTVAHRVTKPTAHGTVHRRCVQQRIGIALLHHVAASEHLLATRRQHEASRVATQGDHRIGDRTGQVRRARRTGVVHRDGVIHGITHLAQRVAGLVDGHSGRKQTCRRIGFFLEGSARTI